MIPDLKRILFPYEVTDSVSVKELKLYRQAAHRLGMEVVELPMRTQTEAQTMLTQKQDDKGQGFLAPRNVYLNIPGLVIRATSEQRIPTMFSDVFFVERGGLTSYGPDLYESGKLAARQVDKILKGGTPADIPVEVNTEIEFAINLKTARELGLTIPPEILFQATKVIR
jgi:putative ABC transport system substrate-binding protein